LVAVALFPMIVFSIGDQKYPNLLIINGKNIALAISGTKKSV
jgi:hypothetical protein